MNESSHENACKQKVHSAEDVISGGSRCHAKHHSLDGLNNRTLFLKTLKAGSPRSRYLLIQVPARGSLPGLRTAAFSQCPYRAFPLHVQEESALWPLPPVVRTLTLSSQHATLMVPLSPSHLLRGSVSKCRNGGSQGSHT